MIPAEVIDRPKGYFPVPALTHLEGPYLDLVRDALYAPAAKERGLFRPEAVERAAGRSQRRADAVARQRTLADRPARTVAAAPRHRRAGRMTVADTACHPIRRAREVIPKRITLACTTRRHSTWWTRWADDVVLEWVGAGSFSGRPLPIRRAGRGAAPRRAGPARHLHIRPRTPCAGSPGACRAVHRPQSHLPAAGSPRRRAERPRRPASRCAHCEVPRTPTR